MKKLLGYLMFLANSEGNGEYWYKLKDKLCKRYGVNAGYDVQYLEGKKCHSCDGSGIYTVYLWSGGVRREPCYRCDSGWYKPHTYVLLERIRIGTHVFHKPLTRYYNLHSIAKCFLPNTTLITGYITHKKQKYGWLAYSLLYILFDYKGYLNIVKGYGMGWRVCWWLPKNWLYNAMHLFRKGRASQPVNNLRAKTHRALRYFKKDNIQVDDLPF